MKKQKAFTLAEVLITITIIGVVATIILKPLITNISNAEYASALKKEYSVISSAVDRVKTDNGGSLKGVSIYNFFDILIYNMKPYLKYTVSCYVHGTGATYNDPHYCWHNDGTIKWLDGSLISSQNAYWQFNVQSLAGGLILSDGTLIYSYYNYLCNSATSSGIKTCGWFYIDVNGNKSPNRVGKDIHPFYVLENGKLLPWNLEINWTTNPAFDCTTHGTSCATEILKNNNY